MRRREMMQRIGEPVTHVYFPIDCVTSMTVVLLEGGEIEVATVGNEGMMGSAVYLGQEIATINGFAQVEGETLRMPVETFRDEVAASRNLRSVMDMYTQALFMQVAQNAVCNNAHGADARCARWLLMTHDRVGRDDFELTQEFLSLMLGVRRATVTVAQGRLEKAGLIRHKRARISVVDRTGLEDAACECYAIIGREYDRIFDGNGR